MIQHILTQDQINAIIDSFKTQGLVVKDNGKNRFKVTIPKKGRLNLHFGKYYTGKVYTKFAVTNKGIRNYQLQLPDHPQSLVYSNGAFIVDNTLAISVGI